MDNSRRILMLPGFSEDDLIFRHLHPYLLDHPVEVIDYKEILKKFPSSEITLDKFISELILHYQINPTDLLIGHSLGGYFAHHIKQKLSCENVLIASFTDPGRIKLPVNFRKTIHWLTRRGIIGSGLYKQFVLMRFGDKDSSKELRYTFRVLEKMDCEDVFKLVRILLPARRSFFEWLKSGSSQIKPSLMIHGQKDDLVKAPSTDHIRVPGGHFGVSSHAEIIGRHLENWLIRLRWAKASRQEIELETRNFDLAYLWITD